MTDAAGRKAHRFARDNYEMRTVCCVLVELIYIAVLHDRPEHYDRLAAITAANLAWPPFAYLLARVSRDSKAGELRNMSFEPALSGVGVAAMFFQIMPLATYGFLMIVSTLSVGGFRMLAVGTGSLFAGMVVGGGLFGFEVEHVSSLPTLVASVFFILAYSGMLAFNIFRVNRRLVVLTRSLAASNRELDDFTHIAAHDLKEPLRGIGSYAQMLREDAEAKLTDEEKGLLDGIARQTQRLQTLITELLSYSKLGRTELAIKETDLSMPLKEVLASLEFPLREKRVEVRVQPLPTIRCDSVRVGELFRNLITNAMKYNDKPERWIEVGHNGRDAAPVFYVRDNGIGIKLEHRAKVFGMFQRLHAKDAYGGGTGVGLSIAQKIVEMHGGRIWLESEPGQGTTFHFTLPGAHK